MSQPSQIRIAATEEVLAALDTLKSNRYPLLSHAEIIKVIISEFVSQENKMRRLDRSRGFADLQKQTRPLGDAFLKSRGLTAGKLTEADYQDLLNET